MTRFFPVRPSVTFRAAAPVLLAVLLSVSCSHRDDPVVPSEPDDPSGGGAAEVEYLYFNGSSAHDIDFSFDKKTGISTIRTTGNDPYIRLEAFKKTLPADSCVFSFEYSSTDGITAPVQLFFGPAESEERSCFIGALEKNGTSWTAARHNLRAQRTAFSWGAQDDRLRMDFGNASGVTVRLRHIRFSGQTAEEAAEERAHEEKMADNRALAEELSAYLDTRYASEVTQVEVTSGKVVIQGHCVGEGPFLLSEITPWMDVTRPAGQTCTTALSAASFSVEMDRFTIVDGVRYDRLLSKWAILKGGDAPVLASHARYADIVAPVSTPGANPFPSKKGVAGVGILNTENDIRDMGATSATMNMCLNDYLSTTPTLETTEYRYAQAPYYLNNATVRQRDVVMAQYQLEKTVPIGIVLVPTDRTDAATALLTHPETSGGYYAMPDLTTPQGVVSYAAVMDFLTGRYNGSDRGRIGHWIMHNEIDAASTWSNMGEGQPELYFMDEYVKSMRLVYNILRQYDQQAWVLVSLTHNWTKVDNDYRVTSLLDDLFRYVAAEGDFQWGVAFHPYPKDLNKPAFWNDDKDLTTSMDVPYVTFYNLEVYDRWARDPAHFYKGERKRLVILSENGTNTPSYSEEDQRLQAAGACWVWKKVKALEGIDAIQWHAWVDHEKEFGLRLGFRKYATDKEDPYGKKRSWYVWQAAGTDREDEVFEAYKPVIGIQDWKEIFHEVQ